MKKDYQDFLKMKERAEELQSRIDESKGVLKSLYTSLEKDFLCKDLKTAVKCLGVMEEQITEDEEEITKKKNDLLEKYGNLLS